MTDSQLLTRLAEANAYGDGAGLPESIWTRDRALREIERRIGMETSEGPSEPSRTNTRATRAAPEPPQTLEARGRRRTTAWFAAVAFAVVVIAGVAIGLIVSNDSVDPATPEEQAVATSEAFFAALSDGDAEAAKLLVSPQVLESDPTIETGLEYLAALPGNWSLSECNTRERGDAIAVNCLITLDGPIFVATADDKRGATQLIGPDGLLADRPGVGPRLAAGEVFVAYASQVEPERFGEVCAPGANSSDSVDAPTSSFVWTGACGELWAHVAEDAAAWVEAGRPELTGSG